MNARSNRPALPDEYPMLLAAIKTEVASVSYRARVAVNAELIELY